MSSKTTTTRDDMVVMSIEKIPHSVYLFISIFIGAKILLIPHWLDQIIYALFVIVVISQVGSMLIRVIVGSLNTFYFHQE